jgi:hypothetical protein
LPITGSRGAFRLRAGCPFRAEVAKST